MPVHVEHRGSKWVTVDDAGKVHGHSDTKKNADASARAINAAVRGDPVAKMKTKSRAPLGSGERFAQIEANAKASGAKNPAAVAAAAGIEAHGKKNMARYSAMGRRRAARAHA